MRTIVICQHPVLRLQRYIKPMMSGGDGFYPTRFYEEVGEYTMPDTALVAPEMSKEWCPGFDAYKEAKAATHPWVIGFYHQAYFRDGISNITVVRIRWDVGSRLIHEGAEITSKGWDWKR